MTQPPLFVAMDPSHLEGAHRLSRAAGWPHRVEDWGALLAVSDGIAVLDDGAVVGTGFLSTFASRTRLNMIIVDERLRGRGIGRQILDRLIGLAAGRPMALTATADGFPLYRKLGFEPAGQIEQYQGLVTAVPPVEAGPRPGSAEDLETVLAADRAATDADRSALLTTLVEQERLFVSEGGFAILRTFGRGRVLGPVVARDADAARALIATGVQGLEGSFLRIDTDPELGLLPMFEAMGLASVGDGTTMYAGPPPVPRGFTTYTLASQALG